MIDELTAIKGKDVPAVCFRAHEGQYIFHGVPKRKIKTEGEFVMLGRKSGAGNSFLHDSLCHCLALCLTGLKSV